MPTMLPIITGVGLFHSKDHFSNIPQYHENAITKLRTVADYELELFTKNGGLSHINGKSYPITKGSFLLAQPGDKRQSTLHFSARFVHFGTNDQRTKELLQTISGFHTGIDFDKYEPLLIDICETSLTFEPDSDILGATKLLSLLCNLKKDCLLNPVTSPTTDQQSAISEAIEYMRQSYMEPLSVDDISKHCSLSSSYFYKLFLNTAHTTPNNYLLNIRLSAAKTLLATTIMPISEVAEKCGFHSQAYFSDCFRRHFQISPRQFREMFRHPDGNVG